jgi:glycosyltransferase involved in cell wall biosynthesis
MSKKPSAKTRSPLKVALVHDYLREYGGAERVVEALHNIFPDAPLYVAFADPNAMGIHWQNFKNWDIRQSWLTELPFYQKLFSPLRIFAPQYFRSFDLSEYDVVISSSNAYFGKAVRVRPGAVHICYCHTPARSLYGYSTMTDWESQPFTKIVGTLINHYLRVVDVKVAQDVDFFIANSEEVRQRIAKFYHREATVIWPPVQVPESAPTKKQKENYFLYVNRLAFAKHPELAVQVCTQLNLPLKVVGSGKMLPRLREIAGPTIEFLGAVKDDQLNSLYEGAQALLYPVEDEDFGIVPIEAMAHGVPVIAHRSGGPKETIIEGKTGIFFDDLTVKGLTAALTKFKEHRFNPNTIYQHAQQYSAEQFRKRILEFVKRTTAEELTPRS